jgi:hypothetical protein
MHCVFKLPNGKEVVTKEFLYKDVRMFFNNSSIQYKVNKLEEFVLTKDLNVVEKFITLTRLRELCIKQSVNLNLSQKDKEVSIDFILKNFDEIIDIKEKKDIGNISLVLDYPSRFVVNTDNIFSVIHKVQIDGEEIDLNNVSSNEFVAITNSLPADVLKAVTEFVESKKHALVFNLFSGKDAIELNFLNASPFILLESLFNCIDPYTYREYLFVLSRRMKDITFLLNSTFIDIIDYMDLYKRENEEEGDKVAKIDN